MTNIYEQKMLPVKWINEARAHTRANQANSLKLVIIEDPKKRERILKDIDYRVKETDRVLNNYSKIEMDSFERESFNDITENIKEYRAFRSEMIAAINAGERQKALDYYLAAESELNDANRSMRRLADYDTAKASNFRNEGRKQANRAKSILLALLFGTLALSLLLSYLIIRNITDPISEMITKMGEVSIGNLAVEKVKVKSQDEIGVLGATLNSMIDNLHRQVESLQQNGQKERLLRDTLSDIRSMQSPDNIYKYLISRISAVFNIDRVFYVTMPADRFEKPAAKYEFKKNLEYTSFEGNNVPDFLAEQLLKIKRTLELVVINDVNEYYNDNQEAKSFLAEYHISSIVLAPLIKQEHEMISLGVIVLTTVNPKIWNEDELGLLTSLTGIAVGPIWDIRKKAEIEEMRNTFMLTLAHDLQVPLVGERNALEYLAARPDDKPIGNYKEMINETIRNNEDLNRLLAKLLDIYNYEAGKAVLEYTDENINELIQVAINRLAGLARNKSVKVESELQQDLPIIKIDRYEMGKVINTLLENAISHVYQDGKVKIKSSINNNSIFVCITDNGPGVPYELREKIFERFAMAQAIDRKIGAGLSLYLTKLIVEAHEGKIWFNTEMGKGSTFGFSLPVKS